MNRPESSADLQRAVGRCSIESSDQLLRQGILRLLAIKDSDVRLLILEQCRDAIDKGLHAGGAFSAVIPLVSLYYGGFIVPDIADPTRPGQDLFVLSKGHAVAALAAIYAELGYFGRDILRNSRSYASILNGHPGPILPGVHLATGPMGQGLAVAQGFAIAGRTSPRFDSYAMCGDGELQEGPIWEAVMYAGQSHLDNLCVLVDQNHGQLDMFNRTIFPMPDLAAVFQSFGWNAHTVDATQVDGVYSALEQFKYGTRNGKPTAIICKAIKGQGAFSDFLNRHKVAINDSLMQQEQTLHSELRDARAGDFTSFLDQLSDNPNGATLRSTLLRFASQMHLEVTGSTVTTVVGPVLLERAPARDKKIRHDAAKLPKLDRKKDYSAAEIITGCMKVYARDSRIVSIDSDLASTSGLEAGVGFVDQKRALNVGVAEANMMGIGEAFAALGCNTWVSTFCPFFDWKVMRRIAVGHQERLEAIAAPDGWLSEGHGLDLTFLATAANFETRTNGATHMGNDDITIFDGMGQLKIIDVSCAQQLLGLMKWIMEGNRGLLYVRVNRVAYPVLYGPEFEFQFGRGYILKESPADRATIVSSGRGVYEALAAADLCAAAGSPVAVVDMPSVDDALLLKLCAEGKPLFFAEQNNGYLWQNSLKVLHRNRKSHPQPQNLIAINTLTPEGKPQFIHSGLYEELTQAFSLTPAQLSQTILSHL